MFKLFGKLTYLAIVGIGLGFGISVVIFSVPTRIQADNGNVEIASPQITPQELKIESINFIHKVEIESKLSLHPQQWHNQVVYFPSFAQIKNNQPILIASKRNLTKDISLGDEIVLKATSNGIYKFTVYHLKEIETKNFYTALENEGAKFAMISGSNITGSKIDLVLAK